MKTPKKADEWEGVLKHEIKRMEYVVANIPEKARVLDAGSSNGFAHRYLRKYRPNVVGIDFYGMPDAYEVVENSTKPDITHDLNHFPYPVKDKSFDCVFAGELIEHIYNPTYFLKECWRILKDNGIIIITTPSASSITHLTETSNVNFEVRKYCHIHTFSERNMKQLLYDTGFKVVKLDYVSSARVKPLLLINKRLAQTMMVVARKKNGIR